MVALLPPNLTPDAFSYPADFIRVVESGILDFEPWEILVGDELFGRQDGVMTRYETRRLVVFAARINNDDVACWDLDIGDVVIIHDYASPGWEQRGRYEDFISWFRTAIDEFIDYE